MRYFSEETVRRIMEKVEVDYVPTSQYDSSLCTEKRKYPNMDKFPGIEIDDTWHTGKPSEEGWYLLKVKRDDEVIYDTNQMIPCLHGLDWRFCHEEIIGWRKIGEETDE